VVGVRRSRLFGGKPPEILVFISSYLANLP
jgi:hypothetical protein